MIGRFVGHLIGSYLAGKLGKQQLEQLQQQEQEVQTLGNLVLQLYQLDDDKRKDVIDKIKNIIENRIKLILIQYTLESRGYIFSTLKKIESKNKEIYNLYYKFYKEIIKGYDGYYYENVNIFIIGLREALENNIINENQICYVLLANWIKLYLLVAFEFGYFSPDYSDMPGIFRPYKLIRELYDICSRILNNSDTFIKCLYEKLNYYKKEDKSYKLLDSGKSYIKNIKILFEYYIDRCGPEPLFDAMLLEAVDKSID